MMITDRFSITLISMKARWIIMATVLISVYVTLYNDAVTKVITAVIQREDSSHGLFIPLIVLYFFWIKKRLIVREKIQYNLYGPISLLIIIALSIIFQWSYHLTFILFICFINGLILTFFGKAIFKHVLFPLMYLVTMIPLPESLYTTMSNLMRTITFSGSLSLITLLDIPFFRDGWDLELPNTVLRVAISCSGIRYLISFLVFGLAYAYLTKKSATGRIITVLITAPVSIVASIMRLTIIFLSVYYISPKMADYLPHVIISWFIFFITLILFLYIDSKITLKYKNKSCPSIV